MNTKIVQAFRNSAEFDGFKRELQQLNLSIENNEINNMEDSLKKIGIYKDFLLENLNRSKYIHIEKMISDFVNIDNIDFINDNKSKIITVRYNKYIPSFLNTDTKQYTSIDTDIAKINIDMTNIELIDIYNNFKEAIKIQEKNIISKKMTISNLENEKKSIEDILKNENTINKYLIKNLTYKNKLDKIRKSIKIILNKNNILLEKEKLVLKLSEIEEDLLLNKSELEKEEICKYNNYLNEMKQIQEGIYKAYNNEKYIKA